jgi:uncharacterized protein (TIGR02246 family)
VHKRAPLPGSLLLLVGMVGCTETPTAPPNTHDADVQAIKDTEAAWAKAAAAKDSGKFASYYTDDGSLLLQDAPPLNGKKAIENATKDMMGDPNFALTFQGTRFDVAKSGELGYSQGAYTMTMTDRKSKKAATQKGKYLTVFKKQADGTWKAVEDMVSSDGPGPSKASSDRRVQRKAGRGRKHQR